MGVEGPIRRGLVEGDHRNVLYLDSGGGYMAVYTCPNLQNNTFKRVKF